ncbi:hypothetical protein V1508DRAFT_400215 [Lipomyces doorenjongii]|uniref:uncharacterized protein n=1 Tax=Lipomyces doorenjongii TaxID=383834 RepID=UPI0034CDA9CB
MSESAGSTNEISSTTSAATVPDILDASMISDCKEAFRLLKDNPPIHRPLSVYLQLQGAHSEPMSAKDIMTESA